MEQESKRTKLYIISLWQPFGDADAESVMQNRAFYTADTGPNMLETLFHL